MDKNEKKNRLLKNAVIRKLWITAADGKPYMVNRCSPEMNQALEDGGGKD